MNDHSDQRHCERHVHRADIEFSYFNRKHCYEAQTMNHCDEGVCFKSDIPLQPGTTVCIRVKDFNPHGACTGAYRGLRSLTLAELKWCKEISSEADHFYEIGAKYYQPVY